MNRNRIQIRTSRYSDRDDLLSMWARCSRESRYRRFHAPVSTLPGSYLADVVGRRPESLVAVEEPSGLLVGVASLFDARGHSAEIGVLVEDQYQRHGIGTDLTRRLLQGASQRGITTIAASVLSDQPASLKWLRYALGEVQVRLEGAATTFVAAVPVDPAARADRPQPVLV